MATVGYAIVWVPPNGLVKRHFGHVTGREVFEANLQAHGDPRFDTLRYVINDFTDCTGLSVSLAEIEEIAAVDRAASEWNPKISLAIVATHPDVLAASAAYYLDPLCAFATKTFSSMSDARTWLRL